MSKRAVVGIVAVSSLWGSGVVKKIEPATEATVAAGSRRVTVDEDSMAAIALRLGFQTVIVLPPGEKVLEVFCGNKAFIVVDGSMNVPFVLIKPAKPGFQTNLNIFTVKGNMYSFLITETSKGEPDLKVFVDPREGSRLYASAHDEKAVAFVSKEEVEKDRGKVLQELAAAKKETAAAKAAVTDLESKSRLMIDKVVATAPAKMNHDYSYAMGDRRPFNVKAIWHDNKFTYIEANPSETPVLYAYVDKKPALVEFGYKDGLFTVQQVLDRGYLAIGKEKLHFVRQE